jgi:hypothetical protein
VETHFADAIKACPDATPAAPRLDDDASTRGPRCFQLQP